MRLSESPFFVKLWFPRRSCNSHLATKIDAEPQGLFLNSSSQSLKSLLVCILKSKMFHVEIAIRTQGQVLLEKYLKL